MLDQMLVVVGVTALVMVIPGPDMILVMRNTLLGGRGAGLQTSVGVLSGNLIHIFYCMLGIGLLISRSVVAFSLLKYAAAAYLVFLGFTSFRSGGHALETGDIERPRLNRTWFVQGFFNNLLNPKGTLFYLGVFTTVIAPETSGRMMVVLILSMMFVSASFWLLFVCTLDRPFLRDSINGFRQAMRRIFGAVLVLLGVRVASMSR